MCLHNYIQPSHIDNNHYYIERMREETPNTALKRFCVIAISCSNGRRVAAIRDPVCRLPGPPLRAGRELQGFSHAADHAEGQRPQEIPRLLQSSPGHAVSTRPPVSQPCVSGHSISVCVCVSDYGVWCIYDLICTVYVFGTDCDLCVS